ncbi:MAG TPA: hypothetical protein VI322_04590 [Candidatus Saccharimonadia bacterium]
MTIACWGAYYLATQTHIPMGWLLLLPNKSLHAWLVHINQSQHELTNTSIWHGLVPEQFRRHGYRKLYEGISGGAVGFGVGLNILAAKKLAKMQAELKWYDRAEMFLRIPNWKDDAYRARKGLPPLSGWQVGMAFGFWMWLYAAPPAWLLLFVFRHAGFEHRESIAYFLIGLVVSPIAKRPVGPVLADMLKQRAEQRVAKGKRLRWYHYVTIGPVYRELIRRAKARGAAASQVSLKERSRLTTFMHRVAIILVVACFILGCVVKFYIAPHAHDNDIADTNSMSVTL